MKSKKILMASLVPFWYRQTGAQQRIFSLVQALERDGHHIKTFFPMSEVESDGPFIEKYALDVEQCSSDMLPAGIIAKAIWYLGAVLNQLQSVLHALPYPTRRFSERAGGMKLVDYQWPWARRAFQQILNRYQPDVIICQYVTTAWLLDTLTPSQRRDIHFIIDTHDLLSARKDQFEQRGHDHWIDISPEEEARVLAMFDTVVAIQPSEAAAMQQMAPDARVIVAGHYSAKSATVQQKRPVDSPEVKLSLGYIASNNASNIDALERFLEQAWPRIARDGMVELLVAGAICETVAMKVDQLNLKHAGNVRLLGSVEDVTDFYQQIDVAINPVQFGTGLKVKTVEAIFHGIPVLTTEPKLGDDAAHSGAVVYCENLAGLVDEVEQLLSADRQPLERLKLLATEYSQTTDREVYQQLLDAVAEA